MKPTEPKKILCIHDLSGMGRCSLAVILPVSIVSAILYLANGTIRFSDAWPYLPGGLLGAILGALLMEKIPDKLLRKAFGAFMIYAAVRLLLR